MMSAKKHIINVTLIVILGVIFALLRDYLSDKKYGYGFWYFAGQSFVSIIPFAIIWIIGAILSALKVLKWKAVLIIGWIVFLAINLISLFGQYLYLQDTLNEDQAVNSISEKSTTDFADYQNNKKGEIISIDQIVPTVKNKEMDILQGHPRRVSKDNYSAIIKNDIVVKGDLRDGYGRYEFEFDENGNLIEEKNLLNDGTLAIKIINKYDNGRLVRTSNVDDEGTLLWQYSYTYSSDNLLTSVIKSYHSSVEIDSIFYNSFSLEDTRKIYKSNNLDHIVCYEYNKNGQPINTVHFDSSEAYTGKIKNEYNNENLLIFRAYFNSKGNKTFEQRISYSDDGSRQEKTLNYNEEGNVQNSIEELFDRYGNIIREEEIDEFGRADETTFQYTFDRIGNWITRITFNNTIPVGLTERKISYY